MKRDIFMELFMPPRAEIAPDDIDDYIDDYVKQRHPDSLKLTIHEYLGMTETQYSSFVADPIKFWGSWGWVRPIDIITETIQECTSKYDKFPASYLADEIIKSLGKHQLLQNNWRRIGKLNLKP